MTLSKEQAEDLLTLKQVAARLQVSTKTVRRLIAKLDIPVVKVGNQVRVPARHFVLFLSKTW
jgi:excisionase family DNA binding protein